MATRPPPALALALALCAIAGLAACNETTEEVDFGAAIIARYFVEAERQCAEIHVDDIRECANGAARSTARLSARTAQEALKTFNANCAEDLGKSRCDELLETAYSRIQPRAMAEGR